MMSVWCASVSQMPGANALQHGSSSDANCWLVCLLHSIDMNRTSCNIFSSTYCKQPGIVLRDDFPWLQARGFWNDAGKERDMQKIIEVRDLVKRFGDQVAVDHINFTAGEGEVFGLLGPNGAGKSTTIKMLTTLLPPTSGQGLVAGYDIARQ